MYLFQRKQKKTEVAANEDATPKQDIPVKVISPNFDISAPRDIPVGVSPQQKAPPKLDIVWEEEQDVHDEIVSLREENSSLKVISCTESNSLSWHTAISLATKNVQFCVCI